MIYVKPKNSKNKYPAKVMPFKTQNGFDAVKVLSDVEIPAMQGFKVYADDVLLSDYSNYIYPYGDNGYSTVEDSLPTATPSDYPVSPSALNLLALKVNAVNNKVNNVDTKVEDITPYTETKMAYIDDNVCEFDFKPGNISAFVNDGQVPCEVNVEDDKIVVSFEELEKPANVTISIL